MNIQALHACSHQICIKISDQFGTEFRTRSLVELYDAVKLGRFQPRQHLSNDVEFIKCTDLQSLTTCCSISK